MNDYKVLDVKCDITDGGIACGPVSGNVVSTVKYEFNNEVKYLNLIEVMGCLCFYLTEKDVFDKFMEDDPDDEEFTDYMCDTEINSFESINLSFDYYEICDSLKDNEPSLAAKFIKYIVTIVRMPFEDMDNFINKTKGKNISEIEIPLID